MLSQKREHAPRRDQLPARLPHIRPHRLPGPLTLHAYNTAPSATRQARTYKIFSTLLELTLLELGCPLSQLAQMLASLPVVGSALPPAGEVPVAWPIPISCAMGTVTAWRLVGAPAR